MRPISLVIDGINSFYDRQEIDFRFDGLFCISGDTGSGKTTILDCIIIALYGSGKRTTVLSDYINLKRNKAEIKFVFEAEVDGQRELFEVTRLLSRDGASRAKLVNMTLGETIAEQANAVNNALQDMIGLTRDDFTQVVILEQGKFAKFLTATKKERNETVGNLFKLSKYKDLGSKFNVKMKSIKSELDIINKELGELKDVTLSAKQETEKSLKDMHKRAAVLAESEVNVLYTIASLEETKRKFDKCIEAQKRLKEEGERAAALEKILLEVRVMAEETSEKLKLVTQQRAACELIAARSKDLVSLTEERNKRNEALDRLRKEWKEADEEVRRCEKIYLDGCEKARNLQSIFDSKINDIFSIVDLGEKGEYCNVFDIKSKADKLILEINAEKTAYEDFDKKLVDFTEKAKKDEANLLAVTERAKIAKDRVDYLKKSVEELRQKREAEQKSEAAEFIREGLKNGDICPVCGGVITGDFVCTEHGDTSDLLAKKVAEAEEAEREYNMLENNRYSFSTRYEESQKSVLEAQRNLGMSKKRLSKYDEIVKLPDKIDTLVFVTAKACELKDELTRIEGEINVNKQKHEGAKERAADIKARGEAERRELNRLEATISERMDISEEQLKGNAERLSKLIDEEEKLTSVLNSRTQERDRISEQFAAVQATVKLLGADAADKPEFDAEVLIAKQDEARKIKSEREELIAKIAGSEKELDVMSRNLEHKRALEAERSEKKKQYDIYSDIYKLVSGDKFIEYIAEEYILQFTSAASVVLGDITGGKYTLEYEGGDFYVKDFLSDGMQRKAGTLSGGETFLASLSLAIAISREIARYRTYEFFFLDEGFGTLDTYSLDMVTNALLSLSTDTLVGVVTHRSELTDRIFDKLTVLPAENDKGSVVLRSD